MSRRLDFRITADRVRSGSATVAAATPRVIEIDPVADPRWDEYVRAHGHAGAYHLGAWAEILRRAYRFEPTYLALEGGSGELTGALPLMRTRGIITGRRLRSLPVVPPAGPLADSDDGVGALLRAACGLTDEWGTVWTLHSRDAGHDRLCPDLRVKPKFPTWVLDVPDDVDELRSGWKKTANNLWRSIRKADRSGVTVRESTSKADHRAFDRLYLKTMRRRTALPRPFRQAVADRDLLGPSGTFRLFVAEHEGDVISGGIYHSFQGTLDLLYQASDEARLDVRPNHALYWHAIEWAAEHGHSELDLGHARPDSSLARFKQQWGAVEVPEYRYDYVPGGEGEGASDQPKGRPEILQGRRTSRPVARVWQHMPLGVTRFAGAIAYRYL